MQVILCEDVKNLGRAGDIVKVSDGYARNYLIPRKLALPATEANMKMLEQQRKAKIKRDARDKEAAMALAEELSKITLTIQRRAGENDALYGSVTALDIAEALKAYKIQIDKRKIMLEDPIKTLGEHGVQVKLHREVTAELKVVVQKQAD